MAQEKDENITNRFLHARCCASEFLLSPRVAVPHEDPPTESLQANVLLLLRSFCSFPLVVIFSLFAVVNTGVRYTEPPGPRSLILVTNVRAAIKREGSFDKLYFSDKRRSARVKRNIFFCFSIFNAGVFADRYGERPLCIIIRGDWLLIACITSVYFYIVLKFIVRPDVVFAWGGGPARECLLGPVVVHTKKFYYTVHYSLIPIIHSFRYARARAITAVIFFQV